MLSYPWRSTKRDCGHRRIVIDVRTLRVSGLRGQYLSRRDRGKFSVSVDAASYCPVGT